MPLRRGWRRVVHRVSKGMIQQGGSVSVECECAGQMLLQIAHTELGDGSYSVPNSRRIATDAEQPMRPAPASSTVLSGGEGADAA
jgi:hypothetical protein